MKLGPVLLILIIAATLTGSSIFGAASLTSYFLYTVIAGIFSFFILLQLHGKPSKLFGLPMHIIIFILLSLYVGLHGWVTGTMGLTHFYWLLNSLLLVAMYGWKASFLTANEASFSIAKGFVFSGILALAAVESIVVLLQFIKFIPVTNNLYRCTGTWVNPNVTALFLAFSLYSCTGLPTFQKLPKLKLLAISIIILAILLLQCRTAYIVAGIMLVAIYGGGINGFARQKLGIGTKAVSGIGVCMLAAALFAVSYSFKIASTNGRLLVWKNTLELITEKPVVGLGFGLYEKHYNLYVASNNLASNGHVNMAYNDFLEITVEGGLIALLFWIAFLVSYGIYCVKKDISLFPLLALVITQATNFGFQAIPSYVLFLLFVTVDTKVNVAQPTAASRKRLSIMDSLIVVFTAILVYQQTALAIAFCGYTAASKEPDANHAIELLETWRGKMHGYPAYHEKLGDAYLKTKQYGPALSQYLEATKTCSLPGVLSKCGYCYQQKALYDSSKYYYTLVQKMEPFKFAPHMALLQLYQLQHDTASILHAAQEIMQMPVKIESGRVDEIKAYASKAMHQITDTLVNKNKK